LEAFSEVTKAHRDRSGVKGLGRSLGYAGTLRDWLHETQRVTWMASGDMG